MLKKIIILAVFTFTCLAGCDKNDSQSNTGIAGRSSLTGKWIRVNDGFENMVIEITSDVNGNLNADLIYVPEYALNYGFEYGDKKIVSITKTGSNEFSAQSLCKSFDGYNYLTVNYSAVKIIQSNDKLVIKDMVWQNRSIGNIQHWERIADGDSKMAFYYYGKSKIAADISKYNDKNKYIAKALKAGTDSAELANIIAWDLAIDGNADCTKALDLAKKACSKTNYQNHIYIDTLAAVFARLGYFENAIDIQQKACKLYIDNFQSLWVGSSSAEKIKYCKEYDDDYIAYLNRLNLYKSNRPYTEY